MLSTDSGDSSDPLEKGQANATGSAKVGLAGANATGPVPWSPAPIYEQPTPPKLQSQ